MKDTDLDTVLLGEPSIATRLGAAIIHVGKLPEGAALPAIIAEIAGPTKPKSASKSDLGNYDLTLKLFAGQRAPMRELDAAVVKVFEGFSGAFGDTAVTGGKVESVERGFSEKAAWHFCVIQVSLIQNKAD
jgi:hypothetical protein